MVWSRENLKKVNKGVGIMKKKSKITPRLLRCQSCSSLDDLQLHEPLADALIECGSSHVRDQSMDELKMKSWRSLKGLRAIQLLEINSLPWLLAWQNWHSEKSGIVPSWNRASRRTWCSWTWERRCFRRLKRHPQRRHSQPLAGAATAAMMQSTEENCGLIWIKKQNEE